MTEPTGQEAPSVKTFFASYLDYCLLNCSDTCSLPESRCRPSDSPRSNLARASPMMSQRRIAAPEPRDVSNTGDGRKIRGMFLRKVWRWAIPTRQGKHSIIQARKPGCMHGIVEPPQHLNTSNRTSPRRPWFCVAWLFVGVCAFIESSRSSIFPREKCCAKPPSLPSPSSSPGPSPRCRRVLRADGTSPLGRRTRPTAAKAAR